jgi:pyruvate/2-oxoglutarate dehydrogenase complex dihydrolipoamide dehydrogenase (E3) component
VPPIPGIEEVGYLTSDTVWNLRELPRRLVVLGGGPIGCEMTQAFARLGAQVTQVEMGAAPDDPGRPGSIRTGRARFVAEGISVLLNHRGQAVRGRERRKDPDRRTRRRRLCAFPSMPCWSPSAAPPT